MNLPTLYSFRRCPYAIRARLALAIAALPCQLHEVELRNKPACLLEASPKGTVPVLVLGDGTVIEQSMDIMQWALGQHDPVHWLRPTTGTHGQMLELIAACDGGFKKALDRYRYPNRHPEGCSHDAREMASEWLASLDERLAATGYLQGSHASLVDAAIFPFVRQFAAVDPPWWAEQPWSHLHAWLQHWLSSPLFAQVMRKDGANLALQGWLDMDVNPPDA